MERTDGIAVKRVLHIGRYHLLFMGHGPYIACSG